VKKLTQDHQTHPKRRSFTSIVGVVLLLAIAVSFAIRQSDVIIAKRRLVRLEQEIRHYQAMNETLSEQLKQLQSDEYIERIAREKLGLVNPGEVQYMLVTRMGE